MFDWYKAKFRLRIDGREWSSDGHAAYAMPATGDDLKSPDAAAVTTEIANAPPDPVSEIERVNGHAIAGECGCAEHLIALAEHTFPGIAWHVRALDVGSVWVGRLDGQAVAIVMGMRHTVDGARHGEPGYPKCPACEGDGKDRECAKCKGAGEVECHACGHEDGCDKCAGTGRVGTCKACGGATYHREATAAA